MAKETKKSKDEGKWANVPSIEVISEDDAFTSDTDNKEAHEIIAPVPDKPVEPHVQPPTVEKPSLIKFLTDYKVGKITREEYVEKMKIHSDTAVEIYRKQADDAIAAAKVWSRKNVEAVKNITKSCLQEIIASTAVSVRKSMQAALVQLQKNLAETLEQINNQDAPDEIKKYSSEAAMKVWASGVKEVQERYYRIELIDLE